MIQSAVGLVYQDCKSRLLLLRRRDDDREFPGWGLPGGKCSPGETPEDTVRREVREETGLSVKRIERALEPRLAHSKSGNVYQVYPFVLACEGPVKLSDEHLEYMFHDVHKPLALPLAGDATRSILFEEGLQVGHRDG